MSHPLSVQSLSRAFREKTVCSNRHSGRVTIDFQPSGRPAAGGSSARLTAACTRSNQRSQKQKDAWPDVVMHEAFLAKRAHTERRSSIAEVVDNRKVAFRSARVGMARRLTQAITVN